jgi:hypothetical protein
VANDSWSPWPPFAPLLDAAERFTAAARSYLEASQASAPAVARAAARAFSDAIREQSMPLFQLPGGASFGAGDANAAMMGRLPEIPALGLGREHQLRWQRTADAGRRMGDAQLRLQLLWSDALGGAAMAFAARLHRSQPATSDGNVTGAAAPGAATLHGLYEDWIDCAEEAYALVAHSDSFCGALADLVNAGSQWRTEVQADMERLSKALDLPTRSELDTLARRLKSVEDELQAQAARPPAAAPLQTRRAPGARAGTGARGRRLPRGPKPS